MSYLLTQIPGVAVGTLDGVDSDGRPTVRIGDSVESRVAAVVWMADSPDWSASEGARVVLAFEEGDEDRPIILGFLDAPSLRTEPAAQSLKLESERELVIECGKAKIALRADGRIEIRGGHLISRSTGPNKIKGGSVHIN